MAKNETMTNKERLACALAGEKPDRIPVAPQLCMAAALAGSFNQFCHSPHSSLIAVSFASIISFLYDFSAIA